MTKAQARRIARRNARPFVTSYGGEDVLTIPAKARKRDILAMLVDFPGARINVVR